MKLPLFFLIAIPAAFSAQAMDDFPDGQDFYRGGKKQLYSDIHNILMQEKIRPCASGEVYEPRVLVRKSGDVSFPKSPADEKNKCAKKLSDHVLEKLNGWQVADIHGKKIDAYAQFIIYPDELFEDYHPGYDASAGYISASFPGGYAAFQKEMHENLLALFQDYELQGKFYLDFWVNEQGLLEDVKLQPANFNEKFAADFRRSLQRIHARWNPATYKGIPVKQRISYTLDFTTYYRDDSHP